MKIEKSIITLPGARLGEDNPLPVLRDINTSKPLIDDGLLENELKGFGHMTGRRVLPYTMQDGYTREKSEMSLNAVTMENEYLRATFLNEYGGRLYSLYDKENSRELLYVNPVFQPCNLGVRNAWFSGGVEWNIGQYGHSGLTCSPVFFAKVKDNGYEFLRMYEYERIAGLFLQIDFHLPDGERRLFAHVTIENTQEESTSLYWWTNTAIEQQEGMRVFSGTSEVISCMPNGGRFDTFKHEALPKLSGMPHLDATYTFGYPYSTEYFFQNEQRYEQAWESAVYDDGRVFYERSTPEMPFRKMFAWSSKSGGNRWQEFLSKEGGIPYLEIQAGLFPTQVHGGDIEGNSSIAFTQAFGAFDMDADVAHKADYEGACSDVFALIEERLPADCLSLLNKRYIELSKLPCGELISKGSGWGALENVPASMKFDDDTLSDEQMPWLELIKSGTMPEWGDALPASYQCKPRWLKLLREASDKPNAKKEVLFHYGIASYENGDVDAAKKALKRAYALEKAPVICYALAALYKAAGDMAAAVSYSREMIANGAMRQSRAFIKEHVDILTQAGLFKEAWEFYSGLDEATRDWDALRLSILQSAYELKHRNFLEEQFQSEFSSIREGDRNITELWYLTRAEDYMKRNGVAFDEALSYVKKHMQPPYIIDFQTYSELEE